MPKKMAVVHYGKCHPEHCDSGICVAALACPHRLLKQEAPYEIPMPSPSICQNCARCVLACPLRAIELRN
ncbi:MAG: hypothetical protein HY663_04150 [Chloroflexi bacterium]|nr:hypothetical protein [Chloroflexota bacterium]